MNILAVGSVAFDDVKTPFGRRDEVLGGSATYFSISASFFAPVRLVAVVGDDFESHHREILNNRGIDLKGLTQIPGETFRWKGEYDFDLNEAKTLETHLNVFQEFDPRIPESYTDSEIVFLANIDPELQLSVLEQVKNPRLVACDTMNFWIDNKPEALKEVLKKVDILVINDAETRQLAGEPNIIRAAAKILKMGPRRVIVKRGEYGVLSFLEGGFFGIPAYPVEDVYDPTGAGDTFAGGFVGYLADSGGFEESRVRQAIAFGSIMASFTVEDFSFSQLLRITRTDVDSRFWRLKRQTQIDDIEE